MAATDSPRRILGDRDINKPLIAKPSSSTTSPGKSFIVSPCKVTRGQCLELENVGRVSLPPKLQRGASICASPPFAGKKRGVACLGPVQDGSPRKQAIIGGNGECREEEILWIEGTASRSSENGGKGLEATVEDEASNRASLCRSVSSDSSFDATQDSENIDSQITTLTEPEDPSPLPPATLMIPQLPARHIASKYEARENAEALRLRLKVAMYKVQTNQTDLPLSQLQIRPSQNSPNVRNLTRTLLPASRSPPTQAADLPATMPKQQVPHHATSVSPPRNQSLSTQRPAAQEDDDEEEPVARDAFATPLLPRSRDGLPRLYCQGTPEGGTDLTSSVVKGRAADGLLSLMGARRG